MQVIHISNMLYEPLEEEVCVAIGNFDGVHLGHQILIKQSREHGYKSGVLTFYPHPSIFLKNLDNYPLITPIEHKIEIISKLEIDYLIIMEFNDEIAAMSKEEFIEHLQQLNIKAIVCGYDFSFGAKALGTIRDLKKEFATFEIPKFVLGNVRVSSTYTRELIIEGNVQEAAKLLGRTYSVRGEVVHGNQLGKVNGFPTANIDYGKYLLPHNGVYVVKVLLNNRIYDGMCNIGYNPTFNYSETKKMEVHLFNFRENIYGRDLEVFFLVKIRNEKKFANKEELILQLQNDREISENILLQESIKYLYDEEEQELLDL